MALRSGSTALVQSLLLATRSGASAPFPAVQLLGPSGIWRQGFAAQPARADDHDEDGAPAATKPPSSSPRMAEPRFGEGGYVAPHTGLQAVREAHEIKEYGYSAPVYSREYLESVRPTHKPPTNNHERVALALVRFMRWSYDTATGYGHGAMTDAKWLRRMIFLETVAGVPGMVGGMLRHLRSLRMMQKDQGWINTLLEEAENERMHLMTFMTMAQPGWVFRTTVLLAQGVLFNTLFLTYLASPKLVHCIVGYLEEEAVKTYTHALECIDKEGLWKGVRPPQISIDYWRLGDKATMRDLVLAVRADEACHAHVNHTLSALRPKDANPFAGGKSHMP